MIGATLNTQPVEDWLNAYPAAAEAAISRASNLIAAQILAAASRNLSGGVLKARTGTLRASLAAQVRAMGNSVAATVTADTPYAAFQEYGFSGIENIAPFVRRQTMAFGRPVKPVDVPVRAHTRRVDYPAHSFLRAALAEIAPAIPGILADALAEVSKP
jgi:hypothetical protein